MKKRFFSGILIAMIAVITTDMPVKATTSIDFSEQNIMFYDPNETGQSSCSVISGKDAPKELVGKDNEEKVYNYFTARGLSPVAAASIMGNIMAETGADFDPFIGESGDTSWDQSIQNVGFGLIQWTNTDGATTNGRRGKVIQQLISKGITGPSKDKEEEALLIELNWLFDGEYGKSTANNLVSALNKEKITGDREFLSGIKGQVSSKTQKEVTGKGAVFVYHKLMVRSADDKDKFAKRITYADEVLKKYTNGSSEVACLSGTLKIGGFTDYESIAAFAKTYIETAAPAKGDYYREYTKAGLNFFGVHIGTNNYGGALGNCTQLSGWFIREKTNLGYKGRTGNGNETVGILGDLGVPTGNVPQPNSVFSTPAPHTGLVLGVDGDGNIYTLEENFGGGNGEIWTEKYTPAQYKAKNMTFAYLEGYLKL